MGPRFQEERHVASLLGAKEASERRGVSARGVEQEGEGYPRQRDVAGLKDLGKCSWGPGPMGSGQTGCPAEEEGP